MKFTKGKRQTTSSLLYCKLCKLEPMPEESTRCELSDYAFFVTKVLQSLSSQLTNTSWQRSFSVKNREYIRAS